MANWSNRSRSFSSDNVFLGSSIRAESETNSPRTLFPGRWFLPPRLPDLLDLADKFRRQTMPGIAQQFLDLATAQPPQTGTPTSANPRVATLEYNMGVALAREGKYVQAEAAYRRALQANPKYVRAYVNLGIALKKQGDIPGAVQQYQTALRLDPDHLQAHHNLGVALNDLGQIPESRAHLARARELQAAAAGK